MPTLIFRKSALRPCEASISAIKRDEHAHPFTIPYRLTDRFAQPLPQFGQFGRLLRIIRHQPIAAGGNGLAAIRAAHQRFRQPLQRAGFRLSVNTCARAIVPFSTSKNRSTPPQTKRSLSRWLNAGALPKFHSQLLCLANCAEKSGKSGNTSGEMISGSAVSP